MTEPALALLNLRKTFGDRAAVDDLSLTIAAGRFYALLGHNGAGKTTTLRMIAGLTRPDFGNVRIFGRDLAIEPEEAKRPLAYLPDEPLLYGKLRPLEYLEYVAGLWGIDARTAETRARELLEWTGLWKHRGEYAEGFSRGMQQKLSLCGALIHEPRLLLLDEPLTGLDVQAAREVKDLLQARVRAGCTVVLTTHILEVAEKLAEEIGVIRAGRLVAEGTLEQLRARVGRGDASLEDVFLSLTAETAA
ncbi:ABC transporter ATP-binding protein [Chitinimonas koreensis]|uniref:ABC transporter ATP-binding protein n=1 Tax=Chitinimonas koreensis TaxID=356302 RepID=UPI0003F79E91|nr:ABC transporter ATP-binding protein [Chitinimonas koreensis]QNM96139.1 ABC transporter ATP-binding protein [Chitinimonas koreensis]